MDDLGTGGAAGGVGGLFTSILVAFGLKSRLNRIEDDISKKRDKDDCKDFRATINNRLTSLGEQLSTVIRLLSKNE